MRDIIDNRVIKVAANAHKRAAASRITRGISMYRSRISQNVGVALLYCVASRAPWTVATSRGASASHNARLAHRGAARHIIIIMLASRALGGAHGWRAIDNALSAAGAVNR